MNRRINDRLRDVGAVVGILMIVVGIAVIAVVNLRAAQNEAASLQSALDVTRAELVEVQADLEAAQAEVGAAEAQVTALNSSLLLCQNDLVNAEAGPPPATDLDLQAEYYRGVYDMCVVVIGGTADACMGGVYGTFENRWYEQGSPGYSYPPPPPGVQ